MAKVVSINISLKKGTVKVPVASAQLRCDHGIVGDAHAGNWHRQISLLSTASIAKMEAMGVQGLVPGIFAENITVEGLVLHTLPVGTRIRVGACELEVTQIGKECHGGCEIQQKVGMCVMPTEGIFARVIQEGEIFPGDEVKVL